MGYPMTWKCWDPAWSGLDGSRTKDDYLDINYILLAGGDICGPDGIGRMVIGNGRLIFAERVIISTFGHYAELPEWWTGRGE